MLSLLQNQQEMMAKSEEKDRLAMQELMKFEMEAEKRHQEFALKELGNIFNKTKQRWAEYNGYQRVFILLFMFITDFDCR